MLVLMMDVREMRMHMRHRFVAMRMGVRFFAIPRKVVFMLVVLVVRMFMCMRNQFMRVFVRMSLR